MNNQIDASIPVLTEVIKPEELLAPAKPPAVSAIEPATTNDASAIGNETANNNYPGKTEEDWQALEQSLRENVLRQVLTRIDFVLEHRIRDNLADVLQIAVANLSTEIRSGLHNTLEEVITRAVTQEISKAKSSK
ncbi:hypothetical protein [Undibacterium pigrum]|uniref:Uncharacterized protein n=1 Tax=Undibacterium pigrum TaxID=401470 RepID=A0A318J6B9_9BURK|nr:hypothetical protein [Undibacterium pigrum]PXX43265.1 hypothetical protein DFR42_104266 [Undibacterium pigrum]